VTLRRIPNAQLRKQLEALDALADKDIDTSDILERTVKGMRYKGLFYRPEKKSITIRLDADVVHWFKKQGRGYQTKMNRVLREYFATHRKA
jgi:uncharacterized protein (DUF4415 family)